MRSLLLLLLVFVVGALAHCGVDRSREHFNNEYPHLLEATAELRQRIHNHTNAALNTRAITNYRIPVVFHIFNPIIATPSYPTITDDMVRQEMSYLNAWFSATNQHYATGDPLWASRIAGAADFGMSFELAAFDPQGAATTGINRYSTALATSGTCADNFYKPANGGLFSFLFSRSDLSTYLSPFLFLFPSPKVSLCGTLPCTTMLLFAIFVVILQELLISLPQCHSHSMVVF